MDGMVIFNVIAGLCSIVGLLISLFTYNKVTNIENQYNSKSKIKQTQRNTERSYQSTGDITIHKDKERKDADQKE